MEESASDVVGITAMSVHLNSFTDGDAQAARRVRCGFQHSAPCTDTSSEQMLSALQPDELLEGMLAVIDIKTRATARP